MTPSLNSSEIREVLKEGTVLVYSNLDSALKQVDAFNHEKYKLLEFFKKTLSTELTDKLNKKETFFPSDMNTEKLQTAVTTLDTIFADPPGPLTYTIPHELNNLRETVISFLENARSSYEPNNLITKTDLDKVNHLINSLNPSFQWAIEQSTKHLNSIATKAASLTDYVTIIGEPVKELNYVKEYLVQTGTPIGFKVLSSDESNHVTEEKIGTYEGFVKTGQLKIYYDDKIFLVSPANVFPADKDDFYSLPIGKDINLTEDKLKLQKKLSDISDEKLVEGQVLIDNSQNLYFVGEDMNEHNYFNYNSIELNGSIEISLGESTVNGFYKGVNDKGQVLYSLNKSDNFPKEELKTADLSQLLVEGININMTKNPNTLSYDKFSEVIYLIPKFLENKVVFSTRFPDADKISLPYETLNQRVA